MSNKWQGGLKTKPNWHNYWLADAFITSQRSIDPRTCHGSVLVSHDNKAISKGYNGPISGSNDKEVPLEPPDKYMVFLHSEENCILNINKEVDFSKSTMYITGPPCHKCLRMILQKGIRKIIHGTVSSAVMDEEDSKAKALMLKDHPDMKIIEVNDLSGVKHVLQKTLQYIDYKSQ